MLTVPLVGIGMPAYNGAQFIEAAIQSLLRQTEHRFELLVSDDCSTDETPAICARLARTDSRIKLIRQKVRLGLTENFRYVLRESRSRFFMWAAQDDAWAPDFLSETLALLMRQPDALGSMSAIKFVNELGDEVTIHRLSSRLGDRNPVTRAVSVAREGGYHAMYSLFRRDSLPAGVELEDVFGQDLALVFGLSLHGRFVVSERVLSTRRRIGYDTVKDSRGRLVWSKALGPSGHLYSRDPYPMCRHMLRYTFGAPISRLQKARLCGHIVGEWSRRAREGTVLSATTRAKIALHERAYAKAIALMLPAALLGPRRSYREAKHGLLKVMGKS